MITIKTVTTAVPAHRLSREEVKAEARRRLPLDGRRMEVIMSVFDSAEVEERYSAVPLSYLAEPRSLTQTSKEYQEHAIALGRQVASECLEQSGLDATEIDMIITVSATGVMIPSLDAHLFNQLGLRPNVRRLPITELGCAAGAAALSQARDYIQAYPQANVLLIAVELPTLTFQQRDLSQANLVSIALFGDGAGAALVTGQESCGVRILDSESYHFADSIDLMGFDLRDGGFHIILSKDIPAIVRDQIAAVLAPLLERHALTTQEIAAFVFHPGGKKILLYLEEELGLPRQKLQPSWDVLRRYGNMSSTSVFFVLREWIEHRQPAAGDYGLLAALGPGFSAELLLLQWI